MIRQYKRYYIVYDRLGYVVIITKMKAIAEKEYLLMLQKNYKHKKKRRR